MALKKDTPPPWLRLARITPDGVYRYWLQQYVTPADEEGPYALWVMLNPSTADAERDDATVRKVREFSRRAGYKRFVIVNLYAFRTPSPRVLFQVSPSLRIGSENDETIERFAKNAQAVFVAWGTNAQPARVAEVAAILARSGPRPVVALAYAQEGQPIHPLMAPYSLLSTVQMFPRDAAAAEA
jgi:hypothetical protein